MTLPTEDDCDFILSKLAPELLCYEQHNALGHLNEREVQKLKYMLKYMRGVYKRMQALRKSLT